MKVAGIDYSSRAVDIVLLDETTDAAEWHRFPLEGQDAFERARNVAAVVPGRAMSFWDDVMAVGIEDPRGYGSGALYRVQGVVLGCIPSSRLVYPWIPSAWRKTVGLKGNADKLESVRVAWERVPNPAHVLVHWDDNACDAYCIALATRHALQHQAAA